MKILSLALLSLLVGTSAVAAEIGMVARINGAPSVTREGATTPLAAGNPVFSGDRVTTDAASKAKILLNDDSVLAIGPGSQVNLDELLLAPTGRTGRLSVLVGRFKIAIADWLGGTSNYEVQMPTAIAGVRGTVLWGDTDLDAVCALSGNVEIRAPKGGRIARLGTGQCLSGMGKGKPAALSPSREELQKYLAEVTLD
jgi:hypothetical protein